MRILWVIVLSLFALPAFAAGAQSDDVSWTLPTQREDGTPLLASEIDRIEIQIRKDGVAQEVRAFPPTVTSFTYDRPLPPNYTLCYRGRTVDVDSQISVWSNEVCKTVKGKPNPPSMDSVK